MAEHGVSPAMHEALSQNLALRDIMRANEFSLNAELSETEREAEMTPHFDNSLQPHGTNMASLQVRALQLSPNEIVDYFMGKLESHTTYLETGQLPDNWPEVVDPNGLVGGQVLSKVHNTAEIVRVSIDSLRSELGSGAAELEQRYQAWVDETAGLLLSRGNIALAAPLIEAAIQKTPQT